eukprot:m.128270 g.128270  ORF g.128270 m.128270 type:complete len:888 (+) comp13023_c0_seq1:48-2711(+)
MEREEGGEHRGEEPTQSSSQLSSSPPASFNSSRDDDTRSVASHLLTGDVFVESDQEEESTKTVESGNGDITSYSSIDWERFSSWATCVSVVTFDLEAGQDVEYMVPSQETFPPQIVKNIKDLAFPDNNSGYVGDLTFTFRFKNHGISSSSLQSTPSTSVSSSPQTTKSKNRSPHSTQRSSLLSTSSLSSPKVTPFSMENEMTSSTSIRPRICPECARLARRHQEQMDKLSQLPRTSHSVLCRKCTNALTAKFQPAATLSKWKYLYGFVYFRQVPDKTTARGYFQKSIVVVTPRPLHSVYKYTTSVIAKSYFSSGRASIDAACSDIAKWPAPCKSLVATVELLTTTFEVRLPQQLSITSCLYSQPQIASICKTTRAQRALDLYCSLEPLLNDLQLLWELVLTASPMIVYSRTPDVCSRVVFALITLISPLEYCGDFRPFFTIYDPDCRRYAKEKPLKSGAIIGVTNPYFSQAYKHWTTSVHMPQSRASMSLISKTNSTSSKNNPLQTQSQVGKKEFNTRFQRSSSSTTGFAPSHVRTHSTSDLYHNHLTEPSPETMTRIDNDSFDLSDASPSSVFFRSFSEAVDTSTPNPLSSGKRRQSTSSVSIHTNDGGVNSVCKDTDISDEDDKLCRSSQAISGRFEDMQKKIAQSTHGAIPRVPVRMSSPKQTKKDNKIVGVVSSESTFLESDHLLVKAFLNAPQTTTKEIVSAGKLLDKSLSSLTASFLIPLEQYFTRLMPLHSSISPFKHIPSVGEFDVRDFLKSVQESLPILKKARRGDWLGLYGKFLKSRNFRGWWVKKVVTANTHIVRSFFVRCVTARKTLIDWSRVSAEVEVIDVLLRIKAAMERHRSNIDQSLLADVVETVAGMVGTLPKDTQQSLLVKVKEAAGYL